MQIEPDEYRQDIKDIKWNLLEAGSDQMKYICPYFSSVYSAEILAMDTTGAEKSHIFTRGLGRFIEK